MEDEPPLPVVEMEQAGAAPDRVAGVIQGKGIARISR